MNIAVFVCDCGTNIASVVDVPDVVSFASNLTDVALAEEGKWICSVDYLDKLKEFITEKAIDRVVVACCSPRTHEPIFKSALEEAGLNPNLLEFASIREHVSWVHRDTPAEATVKAKDLVEMAVAKARLLKPAAAISMPVGRRCMVVGGGITGMTAALALAQHGFDVVLVERADKLGGLLNSHSILAPADKSASEVLEVVRSQVEEHEKIEVRTKTELTDVQGYVGNFNVTLKIGEAEEEVSVSTIILATGMQVLEPVGLCGYGKYTNVITQLEFEKRLAEGRLDGIGTLAIINCVNSRNDERGCCNIGCVTSMKHIKMLKAKKPDSRAFLFYRDLIVPGTESEYCDTGQLQADALIRYAGGALPVVTEHEGGKLKVTAHDLLLEEDVAVTADLVVLVTAFTGDPSAVQLKNMLRVTVGNDDFYQEAHVKLRPVDFASDGIYLAGCGRSPKSVSESIREAAGSAMRASIPMKRGFVESDGLIAEIDIEKCIGCELCNTTCAYGALEESRIPESPNSRIPEAIKFKVIEALCKGCGNCTAGCPEHAITMTNYTDEQIEAQVEAALRNSPEEKQLAFCCHWCALGAADIAGVSRLQYPHSVRIIRVMCSGRVDPRFIFSAFGRGVPGVMVAGCEIPTCHYISGNIYAQYRMDLVKLLLTHAGLQPERLNLQWLSAAQGDKFAKAMAEFNTKINELGPIPGKILSSLDFSAAAACADSERLRLLVGKIPELAEIGNKYGEQFTRHELTRIMEAAVEDEFVIQKTLILLKRGSASVKQLAKDLGIPRPKVFRTILTLLQEGRLRREKLEGTTPVYTAVEPAPPESTSGDEKPVKGGAALARA